MEQRRLELARSIVVAVILTAAVLLLLRHSNFPAGGSRQVSRGKLQQGTGEHGKDASVFSSGSRDFPTGPFQETSAAKRLVASQTAQAEVRLNP